MAANDNVIDITKRNAWAQQFQETTEALDALERSILGVYGTAPWPRGAIVCLLENLEAQGFTIARKAPSNPVE